MSNHRKVQKLYEKWWKDYKKNLIHLQNELQSLYFNRPELNTIQIEITRRCNFKCIMCANSEFTIEDKIQDMSFSTFTRIVDALPRSIKTINLTSYGEATLHEDFSKILKYCHAKDFSTNIFTNGIAFNPIDLGFLNDVIFSLDGMTPDTFFMICKRNNDDKVKASIQNALRYKDKKQLSTKIHINFTISKFNMADIPQLFEFCDCVGIDQLFIASMNNNFYYLNKKKFYEFEALIAENLKCIDWERIVQIYASKNYRFDLNIWYPKREVMGFCRFPFQSLYINLYGDIFPCCRTTPMVFGNIEYDGVKDVFYGNKMNQLRSLHQNLKKHPVCGMCSDGIPIQDPME